ncbi:MAG: hypothetical protein KAS46_04635 [Candidatus Aureabacteria bacterium]|nr:hypothetical protein [Candidatus Auribacterota bacterium]
MSIAVNLLKASHVGVRDFREHLSGYLKKKAFFVITERGEPSNVVLPYKDMIELLDIVDELSDPATVEAVLEGSKAVKSGKKGVSAARFLKSAKASLK